MSFYAGKYNGVTKCHITKGNDTISTLRGNPVADTVFHSSMNYLTWDIYPISSYQSTLRHTEGRTYVTTYHTICHLNNYGTVRNRIRAGRAFVILDSSFNIVRASSSSDATGSTSYYLYKDSKPYYSQDGWSPAVSESVRYTTYTGVEDMWMDGYTVAWAYIVVFNVTVSGGMIALPRSGDDIHITDSNLTVSNINILDTKFVQSVSFPGSKRINVSGNTDGSAAYLYLINYNAPGTGVSISAKAGRTRIAKGTNLIIDTNYAMPSVKLSGVYSYGVNASSGVQTYLQTKQYLANLAGFLGKIGVVVTSTGRCITFKVVNNTVVTALSQRAAGTIYNSVFTPYNKQSVVLHIYNNSLYASGNNWGTSLVAFTHTETIRVFFLT